MHLAEWVSDKSFILTLLKHTEKCKVFVLIITFQLFKINADFNTGLYIIRFGS